MLKALPESSGRPIAREFSAVFSCTNASRARSRSASASCGKSAVLRSATTSSPLHEDRYEFMSLLSPSNHSGQLSDVSLFNGQIFGPPIALPPTFHCPPSWRLCQWQCPHDFWPSSEYDWVKSQRRPISSCVANRFWPLPPLTGSGVLPVTPTVRKPWRVSAPAGETPRNETSSVCILATYTVRPSGETATPCGVMPPVNSSPSSVSVPVVCEI